MTQLIVMLAIGIALLLLGIVALLQPRASAGNVAPATPLINIVTLPSLAFKNPSLIFSDADYRALASEPRLYRFAKALKSDRKKMALQWLGLLQVDVSSLWRLRRLLTSYGVSQGVRAELATTLQITLMVVFLGTLRFSVFCFGPFACAGGVSTVRRHADSLFRGCGAALGHLPDVSSSPKLR